MSGYSFIQRVSQLTTLSPEAQGWLGDHLQTFRFKKNELLLPEHRVCHYLYFICKGVVGGCYQVKEKEVCNWLAAEGNFATSYYSFIKRQPSFEIIECYEDCTVEAISYSDLQTMYTQFPESERAGRLILEEYYALLEERLHSIQFNTAAERYAGFAERRPDLVYRAPLGKIATYLGMKAETLSRIRANK